MQRGLRLAELLPRRSDYRLGRADLVADLIAGLTVGVVALPLALAFGITTGMGAAAGLTTAIVAGLVAAVFGGSNVQVSGPTGAMTVVLVPIVAEFGVDAVAVVSLMAGAMILLMAAFRLGRLLDYMPWPVIEGFTLGIAVIIFLQQLPLALGVPKPEGDRTLVVAAEAARDWVRDGGAAPVLIVLLVAVVMVTLARVRKSFPGSLAAVAIATLLAEATSLDVDRIARLPSSLPLPSLPSTSLDQLRPLLGAAFAIAALSAIESLLSAKVADGMADNGRHDPDRELFGQGLANLASPLFGGMPATGAIARTAVNVRSGARTRLSAIVHALVLLLVVLVGTGLVARIPLAALAGVLMVTAFRMVDRVNVRAVFRATRSDALVLVATAVVTVAFDLILAVEVGVVVAAALALRQLATTSTPSSEPLTLDPEITSEQEAALLREHIAVFRLDGALFFGAASHFLSILTQLSDVRVVVLRLSTLRMLDATGAQALLEIVTSLEHRGITVLLKGIRPAHRPILEAVGVFRRLAEPDHVFETLPEAVAHARLHVERELAGGSAAATAAD